MSIRLPKFLKRHPVANSEAAPVAQDDTRLIEIQSDRDLLANAAKIAVADLKGERAFLIAKLKTASPHDPHRGQWQRRLKQVTGTLMKAGE